MKRILFTLCMLLVTVGMAIAQRTIVGTVTGDDGEALAGATVRVKGGSNGTLTDVAGKYSITVAKEGEVLTFTYTGYETQEVTLVHPT